jgi:hypothetical protein
LITTTDALSGTTVSVYDRMGNLVTGWNLVFDGVFSF